MGRKGKGGERKGRGLTGEEERRLERRLTKPVSARRCASAVRRPLASPRVYARASRREAKGGSGIVPMLGCEVGSE